jgi:hypothetical protein
MEGWLYIYPRLWSLCCIIESVPQSPRMSSWCFALSSSCCAIVDISIACRSRPITNQLSFVFLG